MGASVPKIEVQDVDVEASAAGEDDLNIRVVLPYPFADVNGKSLAGFYASRTHSVITVDLLLPVVVEVNAFLLSRSPRDTFCIVLAVNSSGLSFALELLN